jgi:hypothetical protein
MFGLPYPKLKTTFKKFNYKMTICSKDILTAEIAVPGKSTSLTFRDLHTAWQGKEWQLDEALCCDGQWLAANGESPLNTGAGTKKREATTADCPAASQPAKNIYIRCNDIEPSPSYL